MSPATLLAWLDVLGELVDAYEAEGRASTDDDQLLLTTMNADDGQPIEPVITLHLARPAHVTGISLYRSDVAPLPVTDIGWRVLTFGTHDYEGTLSWCGGPKDTNHDKVPDLVCQFAGYGISWSPGPATVYLNGRTKDGRAIFGTDTVFVTNGS